MDKLVNDIIRLDINEIENYKFPLNEPFGLEIKYEGIRFCFIINFSSKNKNLICCGSGAHARDSRTSKGILIKPPFFDRWSWYKYFDESFIAYSDPMFFYDDEITLGWFVGEKNHWYIEIIAKIIEKIMINQKIQINNTLFYSSSGGGFASICLGTLLKGSKVLINNSQFSILNFSEFHKKNLFRILKKEFPNLTEEEIINKINYRLNTIDLFKKENYIPPIVYYVNMESAKDFYNDCLPFIYEIKELNFFKNNLIIHFYKEKKDQPHNPLPVNESVKIVKLFVKQYLYNQQETNNNSLENNMYNNFKSLSDKNDLMSNELKKSNEVINSLIKDLKIFQGIINMKINNDIDYEKWFDSFTKINKYDMNNILRFGDEFYYDPAFLNNQSIKWINSSNIINVKLTTRGTILTNNTKNIGFYLATHPQKSNAQCWNIPFTIEFDIIDFSGENFIQIYDGEYLANIVSFESLKIIKDSHVKILNNGYDVKYFVNDDLKINRSGSKKDYFIGFRLNPNSKILFKNFQIGNL